MSEQSFVNKVTHNAEAALEAGQQAADEALGRARQASETAVGYIKHDPVKSVLIAAATGAALMALVTLATRHHGNH